MHKDVSVMSVLLGFGELSTLIVAPYECVSDHCSFLRCSLLSLVAFPGLSLVFLYSLLLLVTTHSSPLTLLVAGLTSFLALCVAVKAL